MMAKATTSTAAAISTALLLSVTASPPRPCRVTAGGDAAPQGTDRARPVALACLAFRPVLAADALGGQRGMRAAMLAARVWPLNRPQRLHSCASHQGNLQLGKRTLTHLTTPVKTTAPREGPGRRMVLINGN
jgi:hypothetical protein